MTDKEKDLIAWLQHDPHAAFKAIYNELKKPLFLLAFGLIHNREQAEDIVTDKFAKLWEIRADFTRETNLKAFLWVMVRNACFDYLRKINRHPTLPLPSEVAGDDMYPTYRAELLSRMMEEIEKLSPREKTVLKLSFDDLSQEEIAQQLNISLKTVQNLRSAAVTKLRIKLSGLIWISLPLLEKLLRTCFLETSSATPEFF